MKKSVIILLVCSLAFSSLALPWQSNLEKIKICGMQCAQRTARLTAQLLSMEEPQEKLRTAATITFLSGCLYGIIFMPDEFFGHMQKPEPIKIRHGFIATLVEKYKTRNKLYYQLKDKSLHVPNKSFFAHTV